MRRVSFFMGKAIFIGILLLTVGGTASHSGLWRNLRRVLEPRVRSASDSAPVQPGSAAGSLARVMIGFSEQEEIAIGRQAAGNILGAAPLVADTALQLYVNRVGRWVASQSERPGLEWHFGVIESNDLNAFAAPGGYVFLTKGLYMTLRNESELAGVLAHEIAHVIKKHHLKLLQQDQLLVAGGQMLVSRTGEDSTIKKLIGSGAEIFARSLDKNAEYEADRLAVVLAARAGYDPFGLPSVLEDIGHVSPSDNRIGLLFATHPHPYDRLNRLSEAIGDRMDRLKGETLESRFYRILP